MKVLIVTPSFRLTGGVSFHYQGLRPHWTCRVRRVSYGKRPHLPAPVCALPDLLVYLWQLLVFRPDVVVVNPSFRPYQLRRDGFYLLLASLFGRKVVAMFHGWDEAYAQKMVAQPDRWVRLLSRCSFIYVLCSDFRRALEQMGIRVPILLTTTVVDDSLLGEGGAEKRSGKVRHLLYLARIDRAKGIFQTIDAFALAQQRVPNLVLHVCGSSEQEEVVREVKNCVLQRGLKNVVFHGAVYGADKRNAYLSCDLYLLPSFGEGMATSVLEAMAFGLPVISTPFGGIKDYFAEGKMGFLLPSPQAEALAEKILWLTAHPEQCREMSCTNRDYAQRHFLASKVTAQFEADLEEYCRRKESQKVQAPRVVSVYPNFGNVGGAQNVLMQLATHLNEDVPVVLTETAAHAIPGVYFSQAHFERFNLRTVARLADRRTVFLSHHRKSTLKLWIFQFLLFRRLKMVHVAHSVFTDLRWLCRFPKQVVAVSETVCDNLVNYFRVPPADIRIIRNGLPDLSPSPRSCSHAELRILMVGRVCSLKRQVALAEALRGRLPRHVRLHFAGEGPDAARLREVVGGEEQMKCLGHVPVADIIGDNAYVLSFSEKEGSPLSLLEACRAGVPMLTNDIPPVLEINEVGKTGFVFRDIDALAEALPSLPLPGSESHQTFSKAARETYVRLFREQDMVQAYRNVMNQLVSY